MRITDDALYMEILSVGEQWKGPSKEFLGQNFMSDAATTAEALIKSGPFR